MITRQYLSGCKWCGATGFVPNVFDGMSTTPLNSVCPVCNGSKVIIVTEQIPVNEHSEIDHELLITHS